MKFLDKNQTAQWPCLFYTKANVTINLKVNPGKEYSYIKWHNLYFNLEKILLIAWSPKLVNKNAQHPIHE